MAGRARNAERGRAAVAGAVAGAMARRGGRLGGRRGGERRNQRAHLGRVREPRLEPPRHRRLCLRVSRLHSRRHLPLVLLPLLRRRLARGLGRLGPRRLTRRRHLLRALRVPRRARRLERAFVGALALDAHLGHGLVALPAELLLELPLSLRDALALARRGSLDRDAQLLRLRGGGAARVLRRTLRRGRARGARSVRGERAAERAAAVWKGCGRGLRESHARRAVREGCEGGL